MDAFRVFAPQGSREEWLLGLVALLIALLGMLATRVVAPRTTRLRFRAVVALLVLAGGSLLAHQLISWSGGRTFFAGLAGLFYALALGRVVFLFAFDGVLARNRRDPIPRILRDISQGALFFLAALLALHGAGVEPGQLLTTSALLTVVAGMALQETLGNLVAGLAIQGERPFEVGDWIEVHGSPGHVGKVREINWRATRLHTLDNVDVIVPNGLLAKANVTNYDRPHRAPRRSVYFHVSNLTPPRKVHALVLAAIREVPGVRADPAPSLVTFSFDEFGVQYWLRYFITDMGTRDMIDGHVRDRVWYSLERDGVRLAVPARTIAMHEVTETTERALQERQLEDRVAAISKIDLFASLDVEELRRLAATVRSHRYAPGEVIIRRGEHGDTMFLVRSGELAVKVDSAEAARLGAGAFFGEMSLLTGDPRQATVVAVTACELLVIDHDAFGSLLAAHPEVAQAIGAKVIERQRGLAKVEITADMQQEVAVESRALITRIRGFFGL